MTITERIREAFAEACIKEREVNTVILGPKEFAEFKVWYDANILPNMGADVASERGYLYSGEFIYNGLFIRGGPEAGIELQKVHRLLPRYFANQRGGLRISAPGVLGRIGEGRRVDKGDRWGCAEMLKHLRELSQRFYAGDIKAVDEFLQLYCLDENRPNGRAL